MDQLKNLRYKLTGNQASLFPMLVDLGGFFMCCVALFGT